MVRRSDVPRWHCNKRWTDITKAREALSLLESPKFEHKTWTEGKQAFYAIILNKKGLSSSTNPRSTRAILGTFKFFGFAWAHNRKLRVTSAGKEFIHGDISAVLKKQLLKWQYPNPFEGKGNVAPYTRSLKLFPFRVLLKLLKKTGPIIEDELALFVWKTKSDDESELNRVEQEILSFRVLSETERDKICREDPLFVTNHEYEAHLRPYIVATGLCAFDPKSRLLSIDPSAEPEVSKILSESVEVKTDWRDEKQWFEYFGDTKYYHPPKKVELRFRSKKGPAAVIYVVTSYKGSKTYGVTNQNGSVFFSLYENMKYEVRAFSPKKGETLYKGYVETKPEVNQVTIQMKKAPLPKKETIEDLTDKVRQLLSKALDEEIKERVEIWSRIEGKKIGKKRLGLIRGGRFEELTYRLLSMFKDKVFDDVVWNGRIGEWGLPIPAQKVCQETGKKLPDILALQNDCVYVIETTLLKGRAQWEKPEAVSVPEHVENMISKFKDKKIVGVFIAGKLDRSIQINLITRAANFGYEIVPLEVEEFLRIISLLEESTRDFWKANLDHTWRIHKRALANKIKS